MMKYETIYLKIRKYWPEEDPQVILDILNRYGNTDAERGKNRVHLAILKLCEGRLEKLPELVQMAKRDYRDVLAYAEYPEQMKLGFVKMRELSPKERIALKKRDAKQYSDWIKET